MDTTKMNFSPMHIESDNMHALISWRSIIAGLLVAMITMIGLIGLGLAFGGIGLDEETSARSAGIFTGVWFLVSSTIAIMVGSYFAARVSKFRMGRIGSAQGLVIAALFLGFFLYQTISAIGSAGSAAGTLVGKSGSALATGMGRASDNSTVQNTVKNLTEDALGKLNLRSSPTVVAEGVGSRLIHGDTESAKNYLALEAGITPQETDAHIAQIKTKLDKVMNEIKEGTATALKSTGWSLFLLVLLGSLSAIGGGALGSVANFKKPLTRESDARLATHPA